MNIGTSSNIKAALLGYLLLITIPYSFEAVLQITSIWPGYMIWYLVIAGAVVLANYFGRVSYLGVAVVMWFFIAGLPEILSNLWPASVGEYGPPVDMTPWHVQISPSLIAVLALFACKYITRRLSRTPDGAA